MGKENICPFKKGATEICETTCPAYDLTSQANNLSEERAKFLSQRDDPAAAMTSDIVHNKFGVKIYTLYQCSRTRCEKTNPYEKYIGPYVELFMERFP